MSRRRSLLLALAALLGMAPPAAAQGGCVRPAPARAWPAPLDQVVSLQAREVSLRSALDRLSAAGRVSLSYSPDLLPLARRVCLDAPRATLGDALEALLRGTGVEPAVVAGQVVLVPSAAPAPTQPAPLRTSLLEEIVVTGAPAGAPRRELTVAMDALDGRRLVRHSAGSLGEALNGAVPGVWVWRPSPSSLLTGFGSVRGASSFGATYPKVYLDGVEVANPLLLGDLDTESVERIEVIRGPQGAALYGADAISGVVNIITRHGGSRRPELSARAGATGSSFAPGALPTHEQRVSLRGGTNLASTALAVTAAGTGEVYDGAGSRSLGATGSGRWVTPNAVLAITGRVSDRRAGVGPNPVLAGEPLPGGAADSLRQRVTHYTLGARATVAARGRWTHTLLGGMDGYRLDYLEQPLAPTPGEADRGLTHGSGMRATARATSTVHFEEPHAGLAGSATIAFEHAHLVQRTARDGSGLPAEERSRHDTGLLLQTSGSVLERWYLSAGARLQHSGGLEEGDLALLPSLGAAWVQEIGGAELKLRAAYGRGVRAPHTPARSHLRGPGQELAPNLEPEVQSGIELGAEVYLGRGVSLSATRFDQRATGLIQDVVVGVDSTGPVRQARYQLQNVGVVDNRGWEAQAAVSRGALTLTGSLSLVDSRVARVAGGYRGDLAAGDRMLGVPARTAGISAEWSAPGWSAALRAGRAWDWINYDRRALARDWASPDSARYLGPELRRYWRGYDGATDLGATLWRQLRPGLWLTLAGENLLGGQLGGPDDITIGGGRSLLVGVRAAF